MKIVLHSLFVISIALMANTKSFAQGFTLTGATTNTPTIQNCDPFININISAINFANSNADFNLALLGTNFTACQLAISVNWGDGVTTTHSGSTNTVGSPISWNPPIQHLYASAGMHQISITAYNPQNGSSALLNLYFMQTICYDLDAFIFLDCNNDGNYESTNLGNVPVTFSGPNGFSAQVNSTNGYASAAGTASGNYTASIDPTWLSSNGYVLSSNSSTLMNLNSTTANISDTAILILNCNTNTNNLCLSGIVFCDSDGNGILSASENGIANSPVQISHNGVSYQVYTNNNGQYSLNYAGNVGAPTVVSLNSLWLTQNNYTAMSPINSVTATSCTNPIPFNMAIDCGSGNNPSLCAAALVFCDANGNGAFDTNELPLIGAPINFIGTNQTLITAYSDSSGLALLCGNYFSSNVVVAQINAGWLLQHGYTITNPVLTVYASPLATPNPGSFAVNCGGTTSSCTDLWTTVTPWIGYYQNQTNYVRLNFGNYGPVAPGNYTVTFTFPAGVTPIVSSINIPGYSISGNTITWNLSATQSSFSQTDVIQFNTPIGIASGTQHFFTSTIAPVGSVTDCCTTNNAGSLLQIVGNSYDPNDKTVNLEESISPVIQDELTYTIRFQNTGTAPAQNIHITDTLSGNLDWTTLAVVEKTHTMQLVDLGNGVIRFEFPQIWLPDSTSNEPLSHGHVVFKIREKETNIAGSEIFNTGYIYFDWNPAIITNTTYNFNAELGVSELEMEVSVYPNPTSELLHVATALTIESVELMDLSGKSLVKQACTSDKTELNIGSLSSGIYLLHVATSKGIISKRIVKN